MRTIQFLREYPDLFWPPCIAATALALLCSWLSVIVVLKRLAFIGQGISHAGFGGIGVAAVLGLAAVSLTPAQSAMQFGVVVGFCVAAALAVGLLSGGAHGGASRGGHTHEDTAIGIVLVVSMAAGAVLVQKYSPRFQWESFLFGYLFNTGWADAVVALATACAVLLTLGVIRRPLTFWAFDEGAAESLGVRTRAIRATLMVLLALATVTAMRLAGVVMASALLILPGACALKLSRRSGRVLVLSVLIAGGGVLAGLVLSFESDWPPGPSIVAVLTVLFGASAGVGKLRRGLA
jgi:ABC-type Mn2+/Zn2+ transport system permease subunit